MHADSLMPVLAAVAIVLVAAKLAGELAVRIGQPAVLGELLAGVVLGNLPLVGVDALSFIAVTPGVDVLARLSIGVGMVPRGEVGLIFADIGAGLTLAGQPVIGATTFSAVV